jgi:2Fe-2S ferredoxin
MHVAVEHGVPGIIGECGGELSCATCHVRVLESDATFRSMSGDEDDLLEAVDDREDRSRLGCQLLLRPEMTSVRIEVP